MPLPFLKSSSSKAPPTAPARPPSPLSAANNKTSVPIRSSRPSTGHGSVSGRRGSGQSRDTPSITSASASSIFTAPPPAPSVPTPSAPPSSFPSSIPKSNSARPSTSQSSRSLSSRLLRRRPSEKTSLARPSPLPVSSESEGPTEPLTGSTTGPDLFAEQQEAAWSGPTPIMSAAERRASEADRQRSTSVYEGNESGYSLGRRASEGKEGDPSWLRRGSDGSIGQQGRRGSEWSFASGGHTPSMTGNGFTSLPPPPRKGAKRYLKVEEGDGVEDLSDVEAPHLGLWGRRGSDVADVEATPLPRDHPFAQVYIAPVPSKSSQERVSITKSSESGGRNRFGDAPPMPSYSSYEAKATHFSPSKRNLPRSPRPNKNSARNADIALSPPPRSSSRLTEATSSSPSIPSSTSHKDGLLSTSPSFTRRPSFSSFPKPQPTGPTRHRSNSFSNSNSPHHDIPIPTFLPEPTGLPVLPLKYQLSSRSPKSSSSMPQLQRSAVLSPTRPSRSTRRPTDELSTDASAESDDEEWTGRIGSRPVKGAYEVVVQRVESGGEGEIKWEVIIRPSSGAVKSSKKPLSLSSSLTSASAPSGSTHVNLSLAIDRASGVLSFGDDTAVPILDMHATPTSRQSSRDTHTGSSRRTPASVRVQGYRVDAGAYPPHTRGNTFGITGARKLAMGLGVEEVEGSSSPSSFGSDSKHDRKETITPPRMQTPPPMPSNPYATSTPTSSSRKLRSAEPWQLAPALTPLTPNLRSAVATPPCSSTPRELTYVSSPSPRSTPRRTRIVSASQLNGGLFAHGTVDGMSEEVETM